MCIKLKRLVNGTTSVETEYTRVHGWWKKALDCNCYRNVYIYSEGYIPVISLIYELLIVYISALK